MKAPSKIMILLAAMPFVLPCPLAGGEAAPANQQPEPEAWSFVSIPDFLNFDIEYPQEGWEDALGFILKGMKKEKLLGICFLREALEGAVEGIGDGEKGGCPERSEGLNYC